ncbi:Ubiquinone/menaquinone biosynthesis C-methylase UbiE [Natronorubrum sediminis]|uniref:Ubiquinone/menaquinone biosynthesis C-methylase UbiE n=1 Tax=Natronorubrum sediminis TaxID=640943 RepID=A0A1H6FNA9_9EURY|nr:class I SAM-dependent methyltransferase [Natronorubrum sediminis]SEH12387.1 Ubiquinone/menaquinone biosynthesis C-methylase UbiE [Natronorubrum sediminis]
MNDLEVADYFDANTNAYRNERTVDAVESWPLVDERLEDAASEGDRLLEIGCGDGLFLEYVLEHTDIEEGYGMDISAEMLPDDERYRGRYLQASATKLPLPFAPESFDFVVMGDVLHHLVGPTRADSKRRAQIALLEATTLLKEGGHLIVKDIYYESPVGPKTLTSQGIFYGLKHATRLAEAVDEEVVPGLLVSFYTRGEFHEMVRQAGTTIVQEEVDVKEQSTLSRRVLVGESACIRLYARKNRRNVIDNERSENVDRP